MPQGDVTWYDAKNLCAARGKRLPTEAEWEYAVRAGTTTEYYWGGDTMDGDYAWYVENSGNYAHPAGQKRPNAYGLYDMIGNVQEWVEDCVVINWYSVMPERDPLNNSLGCENRAFRGGEWDYYPQGLRSSYRNGINPDFKVDRIGFRCVQN